MTDLETLVDIMWLAACDVKLRAAVVKALLASKPVRRRLVELCELPHEERVARGITKE